MGSGAFVEERRAMVVIVSSCEEDGLKCRHDVAEMPVGAWLH